MAKPSAKKSDSNITRIKATDSPRPTKSDAKPVEVSPSKVAKDKKPTSDVKVVKDTDKKRFKNPFASMWAYLKGSWGELRQVRWPDRRSTWSMTGALLVFTLSFVVIILVLDYGFSQLFKLILGTN